MATYVWRCNTCGEEIDEQVPIGTARSMRKCDCGGRMSKVLGVGMAIHSDATPNKKHGVRAANRREDKWAKTMPAYKRMRDRGLQPPNIDSAVNLENEVGDQMDINHRQVIPTESKARDAVREQIGEVMETLAPMQFGESQ
jgi:hypothetical protein